MQARIRSLSDGIYLGIGFGIADIVFTIVTRLLGWYDWLYPQ